jgi:hypothetical protein
MVRRERAAISAKPALRTPSMAKGYEFFLKGQFESPMDRVWENFPKKFGIFYITGEKRHSIRGYVIEGKKSLKIGGKFYCD